MSTLFNAAKSIIASTPALSHWSEEIVKAKVKLYRARTEAWLTKSIERDAKEINTNPMVIDSLPEELRDAARTPKAVVKQTKAKAKATKARK